MQTGTVVDSPSVDAAALEQQTRARIETLSYLPTTMAVAMKFIELGKNLDAGPADYAEVIGADSSLSSKLLALANSPWYGVRNKVTSVKMAVNLLGLGTVRTLAISYCMAGLHNELRLTPDESRMFWEASLCRGVAARQLANRVDPKIADEAFVGGMFQDFAFPVMYAVAKEPLMSILNDCSLTCQKQLQKERELFRLDHAEFGRVLAQKLEIPEVFVDMVALHHNRDRLSDSIDNETLVNAVHLASLFPPVLDAWNREDAEELCQCLESCCDDPATGPAKLLWEVQEEFNRMYKYFEGAEVSETRLADLMIRTAREEADTTTRLVRIVNDLMAEAAKVGCEFTELAQSHIELEDKAERDALTGLLNREGLTRRGENILAKSARYNLGLALIYMDIDRFKSVNDTFSHEFGDRAIKWVAERMAQAARQQDALARVGGDEFVLLLYDCRGPDAAEIAKRIVDHVAAEPMAEGGQMAPIFVSAGCLCVKPSAQKRQLETLVEMADKLMYQAKQAGGNRVCSQVI